jgi:hypothetical protein
LHIAIAGVLGAGNAERLFDVVAAVIMADVDFNLGGRKSGRSERIKQAVEAGRRCFDGGSEGRGGAVTIIAVA